MSKRRPITVPLRVEPGSDLPASERAAVLEAVKDHRDAQGALLQILHGVQDRLGWVPPRAVPLIAFELNLSRAEVHGVLSFLSLLPAIQTRPAGDLPVPRGSLPGVGRGGA